MPAKCSCTDGVTCVASWLSSMKWTSSVKWPGYCNRIVTDHMGNIEIMEYSNLQGCEG